MVSSKSRTIWELKRDHLCSFPCLNKNCHLQSKQACRGAGNIAPATSQYLFLRKDQRFTVNWSHFISRESRGSYTTFTIPRRTAPFITNFFGCLLSPALGLLKGSNSHALGCDPWMKQMIRVLHEASKWWGFQKWNLSSRVWASEIPTQGWEYGSVGECLRGMQETLGSVSSTERK